jgi:AcrR family transcriptional regulator
MATRQAAQLSLRERKKRKTRELIAETAKRLFAERGFDAVTVAEVASAADVSQGTVFNYFPAKEDLFFSSMEAFEARLVDGVRERPPGESVLSAFRRLVLDGLDQLASDDRANLIATAARIISAAPSLQAREREVVALYTDSLAALIAEEMGAESGDVESWAVANALMGVQRVLVAYVRSSVLAGKRGESLAADTRSAGEPAFAALERGLRDYAVKGSADDQVTPD